MSPARLVVLQVIDSLAPGGAERSLATVAPHLVEQGIDLHVAYLLDKPGVAEDLRAAGAVLHDLSGAGGRRHRNVAAVRRTIREVHPAVVHTTLFEADLAGRIAGRLTGTPVISSFVSEMYGNAHRGEHADRSARLELARLADMSTARTVARFHAVSAAVADAMSAHLRVRRDRIDVIPRGRDLASLRAAASDASLVRHRYGVPADAPLAVAVGRLASAKGHDVLVAAAPRIADAVPGVRILVAGGDADAASDLRRKVAEMSTPGVVQLCGHIDDVGSFLAAADVLVFPSRREGLPGTVIEAFAVGTPVVCSDIDVHREVVGGSSRAGLLVPPEDPEALASGVIDVLLGRVDVSALVEEARRRVEERFAIEQVAARHVEQYRRVSGG